MGINTLSSPHEIPQGVTVEHTSQGHILLQNGLIAATIDVYGRILSLKHKQTDR